MHPDDPDPSAGSSDGTGEFERHRPLLMGIAYRMLGSSAEAEDAVQDAWLRWQATDVAAVENARAWLSTTVVRLALDRLRSARARRETYPGTWLPEPVLTTTPLDLESIQYGFIVLSSASIRGSAPSSCCTRSSTTATPRLPACSTSARP